MSLSLPLPSSRHKPKAKAKPDDGAETRRLLSREPPPSSSRETSPDITEFYSLRNWTEKDIVALDNTLRTFVGPLTLEDLRTATGHSPFDCYRMCLRFNHSAVKAAREKNLRNMPWWAERPVTVVDRGACIYSVVDGKVTKEYNADGHLLDTIDDLMCYDEELAAGAMASAFAD
ncbi:hypothetical protein ColTof4_14355 [Colletotrichum tofieldiae]|nr:hypothetical protein ColTof3_14766 [Colletotrichum tofieldiae]GKT81932.1 hypothetical protein ColTof4_14355 [Colletotrichum tofieldiae]